MSQNDDDSNSSHSQHLLKFDHDLFKERPAEQVIRVKRTEKKKGEIETWEVYKNSEIVLTLHGNRFNLSERRFLRSGDGVIFLLEIAKKELPSIANVKKLISGRIKNK